MKCVCGRLVLTHYLCEPCQLLEAEVTRLRARVVARAQEVVHTDDESPRRRGAMRRALNCLRQAVQDLSAPERAWQERCARTGRTA